MCDLDRGRKKGRRVTGKGERQTNTGRDIQVSLVLKAVIVGVSQKNLDIF